MVKVWNYLWQVVITALFYCIAIQNDSVVFGVLAGMFTYSVVADSIELLARRRAERG